MKDKKERPPIIRPPQKPTSRGQNFNNDLFELSPDPWLFQCFSIVMLFTAIFTAVSGGYGAGIYCGLFFTLQGISILIKRSNAPE